MSNSILTMKDIGINFGGLKAVDGFNIDLKANELVGLIGPNGAGKTTVFNLITGVYEATEGEYLLDGKPVRKASTAKLVHNGLARTFQNIRLFEDMSVLENVMVAMNYRMKYGLLAATLRLPGYWREENERREKALELLKIFDLDHFADTNAGNLPYGKQRKLEIARAMATNPKVLLLDEPAAGMNPTETEELMDTIRFIRENFNICVFLIEHDMKLVLGICERIIVLDHGRILAKGKPQDVVRDKAVIEAYLGTAEEEEEVAEDGNAGSQ
ncbi:MAG: ABC transporter ATP-binding protein [Eubacteriales bacterium]|nr:ABC transporter ATP-binding protein [Eubacteriales bacterium]